MSSHLPLEYLFSLEISAASGLVLRDGLFHVVADDELSLYIFGRQPDDPTLKIQLLPGTLPSDSKERKKLKPDFESLAYLPHLDALLAVPSGSEPNRCQAILLKDGRPQVIDFSRLYEELRKEIPDLNIEGCVVSGHRLIFLNRGNGTRGKNLLIWLNLPPSLQDLTVEKIIPCDLGKLEQTSLCFTDAAAEADRIWYLAAAEDSTSTYDDGSYLGAVLGCMSLEGQILFQERLDGPMKPEGLALDLAQRKFYVVTDADNRDRAAMLFVGPLPTVQ